MAPSEVPRCTGGAGNGRQHVHHGAAAEEMLEIVDGPCDASVGVRSSPLRGGAGYGLNPAAVCRMALRAIICGSHSAHREVAIAAPELAP
jgi:hypothetical protein